MFYQISRMINNIHQTKLIDSLLKLYYRLITYFDIHFVSGANLQKYWVNYSHASHLSDLKGS